MSVAIVASEAPGVGKSLVAALMGRHRSGAKAAVIFGFGGSCRFSALCAGVTEYRVDGGDMSGWDRVVAAIKTEPATICVGSGASISFLNWCAESRVGELTRIIEADLVIPVTHSEFAMSGAARTIQAARANGMRQGLRVRRVVLILNERDGDPRELARSKGLLAQANTIVKIGRAPEIVGTLEASGRRFDALERFVGKKGVGTEVGAMFGWDKFRAGHEMALYREWLWDCEENLQVAGLLR